MTNREIAAQFDLLAQLMELHGENKFKIKAYATAAYTLKKWAVPIGELDLNKVSIPGIGVAITEKIQVLLSSGTFPQLQKLIDQTPAGVIEMLQIKGVGPSKIAGIWKELGVETLEDLAKACESNQLTGLKGFGAKTQQDLLHQVRFFQEQRGYFLYAVVAPEALSLLNRLKATFVGKALGLSGAFRRQMPTLKQLDLVGSVPIAELSAWLEEQGVTVATATANQLSFILDSGIPWRYHFFDAKDYGRGLFLTTNPEAFNAAFEERHGVVEAQAEERAVFEKAGLPFVAPALRDDLKFLDLAARNDLPDLICTKDLKGLIHSHSTFSDGMNTVEEMALAAQAKGYEYLVMSDHSQAAFYANGMKEADISRQHQEIDRLNERMAPFRIFKAVEVDILSDGRLDYEDECLERFELVIASIHSQLNMDEKKTMKRLLKAIENPFTRILGHATGRLLLERPGYPVNHKQLIEACVANRVVIEINASPKRLDLDWSWISFALERGALLSINPDAHNIPMMDYVKYGVLAAQKGGLEAKNNLSSFSLTEFEAFLAKRY